MKILALRVKNLTSLAGEVALDFEAPPLAQAGLFAITGPTGAGKSTLLDALCLALYGELPRLAQGGDVRSVLRHGAAEGFAEVDFVGRDGGRYRAKWQVRRAGDQLAVELTPNEYAAMKRATTGDFSEGDYRLAVVTRALSDDRSFYLFSYKESRKWQCERTGREITVQERTGARLG